MRACRHACMQPFVREGVQMCGVARTLTGYLARHQRAMMIWCCIAPLNDPRARPVVVSALRSSHGGLHTHT
eukprot:5857846-Alexandrium_andersonii.AAC.1